MKMEAFKSSANYDTMLTRFWFIAITPDDHQHILLNCLNHYLTGRLGQSTIAKMAIHKAFYL